MSVPITAQQLRLAAVGKPNAANLQSVLAALDGYGGRVGLNKPHRLAQFLAQLMHESGDFRYDKEIWGPTAAQKGYEGRKDLGNLQKGDGSKYRGRGPIQITGRANYRSFTAWAKKLDTSAPNFEKDPEAVNTDPWEGLVAIWYWDTRKLNTWADQGDLETVTKKINGGKNGLAERIDRYGRVSLVLLGYGPTEVKRFQKDKGLEPDGDVGPKTRSALHTALVALVPGEMDKASVTVAPVTEEKKVEKRVEVEKPVVPQAVETKVKKRFNLAGWIGGIFSGGGLGALGLAGMDWQAIVAIGGVIVLALIAALFLRHYIIAAIKEVREAVEA